MKFNPKEFVSNQLKEGISFEKAIFMVGFKTAIDCIGDIKDKGVPFEYDLIRGELETTFSKLKQSQDFLNDL